ncbi:hypothetical protein V6N12_068273 [Hibiscus sabdariffa]|uniref:Transposase MuDR plant domain-containing protein n=1 Tax=Hibiscus sabdariffa TaxID=183260 RepID=A0ABR2FPI2_9ROSI
MEDIEFEDRNINEVDEVDRSGGVEEEGVLPSVERDDEADISRGDEDVEWLLMVFENSKQFKSALTRYTIVKRFDFKLAKNEKDKARVVCKDNVRSGTELVPQAHVQPGVEDNIFGVPINCSSDSQVGVSPSVVSILQKSIPPMRP